MNYHVSGKPDMLPFKWLGESFFFRPRLQNEAYQGTLCYVILREKFLSKPTVTEFGNNINEKKKQT